MQQLPPETREQRKSSVRKLDEAVVTTKWEVVVMDKRELSKGS